MFALITITTATFLILHNINKLIATKLTQNDRAALFIVFVLVVLRVIKEISKETLFNKIEVAVGAVHLGWFFIKYAVLMFLYFITSLLMNLALYTFFTGVMFWITSRVLSLYFVNEEIVLYAALTITLWLSTYLAGLYSKFYKFFKIENLDIGVKHKFEYRYNKLINGTTLKIATFSIAIFLVIISAFESLSGMSIFAERWWILSANSVNYTIITLIAIDRLERYISSIKKRRASENQPEPSTIELDDEKEMDNKK